MEDLTQHAMDREHAAFSHGCVFFFRRHAGGVRCIATVIGGEGFIAATKRTVVATIAMIARQPIPLQIFDEPRASCRWVCERLTGMRGSPSSAGALEDALANIELQYDAYLTRG